MDEPLERLIRISTEGARLYVLFIQLKLSGKRTGEKTPRQLTIDGLWKNFYRICEKYVSNYMIK